MHCLEGDAADGKAKWPLRREQEMEGDHFPDIVLGHNSLHELPTSSLFKEEKYILICLNHYGQVFSYLTAESTPN